MIVVTTPEASVFIEANGGVAYVRPLTRKCCGGALTVLSATTEAPADERLYEPVGDPALGVRYRRNRSGRLGAEETGLSSGNLAAQEPEEMLVELRGHRRPRLAACWNGCAFKM